MDPLDAERFPSEGGLTDGFGRTARKLRVSVTDRCNLRCVYCMPSRPEWLPRPNILRFDEIERIVAVAASLGVDSVRLTGGEPTARQELPALVRRLAGLPGLRDLSMTTNGILLDELARPLREAGLHRMNVSLDTLRGERFVHIARRDGLRRVLRGLEAAEAAGFRSIKVNMVVLRGVNEDEVVDFAALARSRPWQVRFIEFMPLDGDAAWSRDRMVPAADILARIRREWPLEEHPGRAAGDPARIWRFRDGRGEVGVIASVSAPFCSSCDRIRISADGKLRACLFGRDEVDLKGPLRSGAGREEIAALFRACVAGKPAGHGIDDPSFRRPALPMHVLGG